jgi:hypothetical protein
VHATREWIGYADLRIVPLSEPHEISSLPILQDEIDAIVYLLSSGDDPSE